MISSVDGATLGIHSCGSGDALIVEGGALRGATDYMRFATALAGEFEVHVVDRRGRGSSSPLGDGYSLETEIADLLAVQERVGASRVFGHSYGGLIALHGASRSNVFQHVAVYEPAVSVNGSIPTNWTDRYQQLLAHGDRRGAFAYFVQQSGQAPGPVAHLPLWYLRTIMRFVVRGEKWARMDALLEASALEHLQVGAADTRPEVYEQINARVLLLGGSRSPAFMTAQPFDMLRTAIPECEIVILPGLDHLAPDDKAPEVVAERVIAFLTP